MGTRDQPACYGRTTRGESNNLYPTTTTTTSHSLTDGRHDDHQPSLLPSTSHHHQCHQPPSPQVSYPSRYIPLRTFFPRGIYTTSTSHLPNNKLNSRLTKSAIGAVVSALAPKAPKRFLLRLWTITVFYSYDSTVTSDKTTKE